MVQVPRIIPNMLQPNRSRNIYRNIKRVKNVTLYTYLIPPALPEVRVPMSETNFNQFEGQTCNPSNLGVSDNHHFEPPASEMCDEVDIINVFHNVGILTMWVLGSEHSAV